MKEKDPLHEFDNAPKTPKFEAGPKGLPDTPKSLPRTPKHRGQVDIHSAPSAPAKPSSSKSRSRNKRKSGQMTDVEIAQRVQQGKEKLRKLEQEGKDPKRVAIQADLHKKRIIEVSTKKQSKDADYKPKTVHVDPVSGDIYDEHGNWIG